MKAPLANRGWFRAARARVVRANRFVADRSGVTAIEYGLIAGIISTALLSSIPSIQSAFAALARTLAAALSL